MMPLFAFYIYLHLPILIALICLVYSATRHDDWNAIFDEGFRWTLRMSSFLGAIALALLLLHWFT